MILIIASSCSHDGNKGKSLSDENKILQQKDGSVSLNLQTATCYNDDSNPANNTADWYVVISRPGRFKVWLSSATKDTLDLNYSNSVRISLLDNNLEVIPACDKIIKHSDDVPSQYFRADSYVGSIYFSEPGEYNVQLISEKAVKGKTESKNETKLMSVILTPILQ